MDGLKAVKEEAIVLPQEPTTVVFKPKDDWNKFFYFIKPKSNPRFLFGAPALPLDTTWLTYDKDSKDKTRQATSMTVKFAKYKCKGYTLPRFSFDYTLIEHADLKKFGMVIQETNELNPHETNIIPWYGPTAPPKARLPHTTTNPTMQPRQATTFKSSRTTPR